jgi:hypothetical protein
VLYEQITASVSIATPDNARRICTFASLHDFDASHTHVGMGDTALFRLTVVSVERDCPTDAHIWQDQVFVFIVTVVNVGFIPYFRKFCVRITLF